MVEGISVLDALAIAILVVSCVTALFKGLLRELVSLGSVVAGVVLAVLFYDSVAVVLVRAGVDRPLGDFVAFLAIFVVGIVAGALLSRLLEAALKALKLRWFDRLMGGAFGLLRGWLINAVVFFALATFPVGKGVLAESQLAEFFLTSARVVVAISPDDLKTRFDRGFDSVYKIWLEQSLNEHSGTDGQEQHPD